MCLSHTRITAADIQTKPMIITHLRLFHLSLFKVCFVIPVTQSRRLQWKSSNNNLDYNSQTPNGRRIMLVNIPQSQGWPCAMGLRWCCPQNGNFEDWNQVFEVTLDSDKVAVRRSQSATSLRLQVIASLTPFNLFAIVKQLTVINWWKSQICCCLQIQKFALDIQSPARAS